jgi:hypothetical protein
MRSSQTFCKMRLNSAGCSVKYYINGDTKTKGWFWTLFRRAFYSCGRRERRFEASFGHPKLDKRPRAATDPHANTHPPAAQRGSSWGHLRPCLPGYPSLAFAIFLEIDFDIVEIVSPVSIYYMNRFSKFQISHSGSHMWTQMQVYFSGASMVSAAAAQDMVAWRNSATAGICLSFSANLHWTCSKIHTAYDHSCYWARSHDIST